MLIRRCNIKTNLLYVSDSDQGIIGCIISDESANFSKFEKCDIEICSPPFVPKLETGPPLKLPTNLFTVDAVTTATGTLITNKMLQSYDDLIISTNEASKHTFLITILLIEALRIISEIISLF